MDGVLLLDKPAGMTSMRAVERVKRLLGIRKAGHTGTLDPLATGVLAICIGQATRVAGLMLATAKGYQAQMTLGVTTNTLDSDGEIELERPISPAIDEAHLRAVFDGFLGPQSQMPPAFSALKVNGKRAYALAREGKEIELAPRSVHINYIQLDQVAMPQVTFTTEVSKGTYIRSLIRDVGELLGCGAHMSALRRLNVGHFLLKDTITLEQIEANPEAAKAAILPVGDALSFYPILEINEEETQRLEHGLISYSLQLIEPQQSTIHRILRDDGSLLALLQPVAETPGKRWKVHKVFTD